MKHTMKGVCIVLLFFTLLGVSVAQMPPIPGSGYTDTSVSIRTHRWMDADNYYLGVILEGINPAHLDVIPRGRSLRLHARHEEYIQSNGGMSMSSGSASVSVMLPPDAEVNKIKRVVTGRDLVIVLPRLK